MQCGTYPERVGPAKYSNPNGGKMRVTSYHWQHIDSLGKDGDQGVSLFTYDHFRESSSLPLTNDRAEGRQAFPMPRELALKLVNKWNGSEAWKYWID